MLPDPLSVIWCCADNPDPVLTGDEILDLPSSVFDLLVSLGFLHQAETAKYITCNACTEQHVEEIFTVKSYDGCKRFFIRCPENGRIEVDRELLRQWAIDYSPLLQAVSSVFSTSNTYEEIVPGRIWNLGRATLACQSRMIWVARGLSWPDAPQFKEILPNGRSPVLFFIGQPPMADLVSLSPESMIDLKSIINIKNNNLTVDRNAVESQLRQLDATQSIKKAKPKKRASRTVTIDKIKQELRRHLSSARDHAYSSFDRGFGYTLLSRPSQQQLAAQLDVSVSSISRAINDNSDKEIKILWEAANDINQIKKYQR
jgi:hypothetical protein